MKKAVGIIFFALVVPALTTLAYHGLKQDWVKFRRAEQSFSARAFEQAQAGYLELARRGFSHPLLFPRLVAAQLAMNDERGVRESVRLFAGGAACTAPAAVALSEQLACRKMFSEALAVLRPAVARFPESRKARFQLAQVLMWTGRFEEAIVQYRILLGETTG